MTETITKSEADEMVAAALDGALTGTEDLRARSKAQEALIDELVSVLTGACDPIQFAHRELTYRSLIPNDDGELMADRLSAARAALAKAAAMKEGEDA